MNTVYTTVKAILNSYAYNREFWYMVELCEEVFKRVQGVACAHSDDGDIIYGFLVLMYGEYGTSPRSGWITDNLEEITGCLNDHIIVYKRFAKECEGVE